MRLTPAEQALADQIARLVQQRESKKNCSHPPDMVDTRWYPTATHGNRWEGAVYHSTCLACGRECETPEEHREYAAC